MTVKKGGEWEPANPNDSSGVENTKPKNQQIVAQFKEYLHSLSKHQYLQELYAEFTILQKAALESPYTTNDEDQAIIGPERFVLKNPNRITPYTFQSEHFRSPRPEVNKRTGDLKWEPDQGNHFSSILPTVETSSSETRPKDITQWTYQELNDFLIGQSQGRTDLNQRMWLHSSPKEKLAVLKNRFDNLDNLKDKFPKETPDVKKRLGVQIIEVDSAGEIVEFFYIYIVKNPNYSPTNFYGKRADNQNEWQVVVKCGSGHETIYNWGEGEGLYNHTPLVRKPVIYLYPTQTTQVSVNLDYTRGPVVVEYPKRENGSWNVNAQPDGKLLVGDKEYPYLFWEAKATTPYQFDQTEGFCLGKDEFVPFFEEKLKILGLNDKEIADFITYWYPLMASNPFTYVNFLGQEYLGSAKLTVSPTPDSTIRVFVLFKSMTEKVNLKPQELAGTPRNGFTLVEWGGSNLDDK